MPALLSVSEAPCDGYLRNASLTERIDMGTPDQVYLLSFDTLTEELACDDNGTDEPVTNQSTISQL